MSTQNGKTVSCGYLPTLSPDTAWLDIGPREIWASVPMDRHPQPVCAFATALMPDLQALADWLAQCRIKTVTMESTGADWIPAYNLLEAYGFQVYLVNRGRIQKASG